MTDSSKIRWLESEIRAVLGEISGSEIPEDAGASGFLELGLDSLILTQAAQALAKRVGVPLKLRHLAQEYSSTKALAGYLLGIVSPDRYPKTNEVERSAPPRDSTPRPLRSSPTTSMTSMTSILMTPTAGSDSGRAATGSAVERLIRDQLALMARQLEILGRGRSEPALAPESAGPGEVETPAPSESLGPSSAGMPTAKAHGPQLVIHKTTSQELSPTQSRHLSRFVERYSQKTRRSKEFTERNRAHVADPRTVAGFKPSLKELVYPIVVEKSRGCHLWDLDGNRYVDLLSGYGSNFFGFGADFVRAAIVEQTERGMEIGPQTNLVEEVTDLFRELTGAERVAYCNTGSEAVLATLRMARTVTGRDLVVIFEGGYHGMFDEVVVRRGLAKSVPAAPGIPFNATESILVLPWASEEALHVLRERIEEIAAIVVEPVQSRRPGIQPAEFLLELRRIATDGGAALVFDEVVTGFRVAPGGAQQHFGIQADLASYGKVIGGGLSLGVVAGKREFMDALDGGHWQFGDESVPEVGVTYFAGTFVRHPLHLAVARAVLRHLKAEGPALQARVSARTARFADRVNALFRRTGVPFELAHFASIMKLGATEEIPFAELLFAHLRERGVHVWEGRPNFLTDAHSDEDLEFAEAALASAVDELQQAEFLPASPPSERAEAPPAPGARLGRDPNGMPTWYIPDSSEPTGYRPLLSEA